MLCPNQLRENGIQVNDIPLMYTPIENRTNQTHAIVTGPLIIPLQLDGVHSSFTCRLPTDYELAHPHLFTQTESGNLMTLLSPTMKLRYAAPYHIHDMFLLKVATFPTSV
jgi:hypothetical protein